MKRECLIPGRVQYERLDEYDCFAELRFSG